MVVGVGGIGGMRDLGDPYDPRRAQGGVPQAASVPGLPDAPQQSRFDQLAAIVAPQNNDEPERVIQTPRGIRRDDFEAAVASAEQRQIMVARLQAAQSPREKASVLGEFTGVETSDAVAETATRLLVDPNFNFDPTTAVQAAQIDVGEYRGIDGLQASIEKTSNAAAIEPADKALNRNLRDGSEELDFDNPAVTQAPSAYEALQNEVAQGVYRQQNALKELGRTERQQANAVSGNGSRINGRANPLDKERFERIDPFQVPVIMGPQRVNARNELAAPQITTEFNGRRPTTVFDASQAHLAMLNPAAQLPAEFAETFGYVRGRTKPQTETGSYSKTPDVPTVDPSSSYVDEDGNTRYPGFNPYDDPAYTNRPVPSNNPASGRSKIFDSSSPRYVDSVPMTLGQAVDQVMLDHRTPISTLGDNDVIAIAGDRFIKLPDGSRGKKIYSLKNQREEDERAGLTAYRVGSPDMYDEGFEPELVQLFRGASGAELVVDGAQKPGASATNRLTGGERLLVAEKLGFYDTQVRNQQAQLLVDSFDERMLGSYAEDLQMDSKKALMAVATLLAKGKHLSVEDGATPVSAYPTKRSDFSSAAVVQRDAAKLAKLGQQRIAKAKSNRVRQKFKAEDTTPRPAAPGLAQQLAAQQAEAAGARSVAMEQSLLDQELKLAAQALAQDKADTKVFANNQQQQWADDIDTGRVVDIEQRQAFAADMAQREVFASQMADLQADAMTRASAVSEQNPLPPQSVSAGVMNTDDVSQLNAPEAPTIRSEPTPRQQQIAASAPAQATNAGVSRGRERLDAIMALARRNPYRTSAAVAGDALGTLGAIPWDPSDDQ